MSDAERWDEKYRSIADSAPSDPAARAVAPPRAAVVELAEHLPPAGAAIDVAGGRGNTALWLAERGLDVTLSDVSQVALGHAAASATEHGLTLATEHRDVEADGIDGQWDLIVVTYFLNRTLLHNMGRHLTVGGSLLFVQPTVTNLERHAKPSRRFLLADGEVHTVAAAMMSVAARDGRKLEIRHVSETWRDETHEARLVVSRLR